MNRNKLIATTLIIIGIVALISLLRATEPDPVFDAGNIPSESYPEVAALAETTDNFAEIEVLEEEGEPVRIEPELNEDAYQICAEFTCIGTIEVFTDTRYIPLEGQEINITTSGTDAFVLRQLEEIPRPFRIQVQVLDMRAKVITRFYSDEIR